MPKVKIFETPSFAETRVAHTPFLGLVDVQMILELNVKYKHQLPLSKVRHPARQENCVSLRSALRNQAIVCFEEFCSHRPALVNRIDLR